MIPTRRTLLRGLAAAPLATLPVLDAAHALALSASFSAVTDLEARYDAAAQRSAAAHKACGEADERLVYHAPPEALFVQPDDPLARCFTPDAYFGKRAWFGSDERIGLLRSWDGGNMRGPVVLAALPRRAEVLAAYDGWQSARKAAEDAAGITAATAEYKASWVEEKAIRLEILELRSPDLEVLRLKLRVFMDSQSYGDWREGVDAAVAQGLKVENGPWEDAFAASIMRDLATAYMGSGA